MNLQVLAWTGFGVHVRRGGRCASIWLGGLLVGLMLMSGSVWAADRERLSLDAGWLFHAGDVTPPPVTGHGASYHQAKAGGAVGAAAADFDDSDWRRLDLPHDWAIENPLDRNENPSQGYRARGIGWYRRYFRLPDSDQGRYLELQFDGIATHSTVWVNGIVVNRNWSGYNGRSIDITPFVRFGDDINSIAVRVDADAQEGWWYEGAGIYRHTWLEKRDALHIATDGVHANPKRQAGQWVLPVEVQVDNSGEMRREATLDVRLIDPAGNLVLERHLPVQVEALSSATLQSEWPVDAPALWSVQTPQLYQVETVLRTTGSSPELLDRLVVTTGFRSIHFDAQQGFFLNDRSVKLQGVCIHQDHAGVGVAVPESIWAFRLQRLQDMGVNAIRFAHNAVAPEVMDLTDRMGFLVMDENRNFSASPEALAQLEWLVRRDRNRPSVVMWSLFNEEPLQGSEQGREMARRMVAAIKRLDATRPVTAGMHDGLFAETGAAQVLDVVGINYQVHSYDRYHQENPTRPLTSSEDTSAYMTRGAWESDRAAQVLRSDDTEPSSWGNTHREAWRWVAERPFMAGSFVWSGFDYHGEPTPFEWPSASTFFGALDLTGAPKAAFYIRQAHWVKDRPVVKLLPHWNWEGREGQHVSVLVASNAPRVRLLLNGKQVDERDVDPIDMVQFEVPWTAGTLEAVALQDGRELARDVVQTSAAPARLVLTPERRQLAGDGRDAVPIWVSVVDARGRTVPTANMEVAFEVSGPATVIGVGNGDPNSHASSKAPHRALFNGLAQLIVQTQRDGEGRVRVRASAPGLRAAEMTLDVRADDRLIWVPNAEAVNRVKGWRISPAQSARPDPQQTFAAQDMNSWGWGEPPIRQSAESSPWRIYRANLSLRADRNDGRGRLVFDQISGEAEIWVDGVKLAEKTSPEPAGAALTLPAGPAWRTVSVLLRSQPGAVSGLTGGVRVEAGQP